jgi:hypothetical protein
LLSYLLITPIITLVFITMVDVNKLLGSFLSSGAASGFAGGLDGSMASKVISGEVKKMGSSALKLGGVAAVGALAYTATNVITPLKQPLPLKFKRQRLQQTNY